MHDGKIQQNVNLVFLRKDLNLFTGIIIDTLEIILLRFWRVALCADNKNSSPYLIGDDHMM